MPLYEYRCKECDHLEEVLQKVSDPAPATCPSCGKEHTMAKEVSLTSFQLKGGGWYKDLYSSVPADKADKGDKAKKPEKASASAAAASSTSSASTSSASTSSASSSSAPSSGGTSSGPGSSSPTPSKAA